MFRIEWNSLGIGCSGQHALAAAAVALLGIGLAGCSDNSSSGAGAGADAAAASSGWQLVDKTDKVSGARYFDAEATLNADNGDSFDLKGECSPGFVNFTLTDTTSGSKFQVQQADNGSDAYFMRTRLDAGEVAVAHSDVAYTNSASIFFYDPDIAPRSIADGVAGQYGRVAGTADSSADATGQMAGSFVGALTGMMSGPYLRAAGAGTIGKLEAANQLVIEVPLADSRAPTLTISLGDQALQSFFRRCDQQTATRYPAQQSSATDSSEAAAAPAAQTQSAPEQPAQDAGPPQQQDSSQQPQQQ